MLNLSDVSKLEANTTFSLSSGNKNLRATLGKCLPLPDVRLIEREHQVAVLGEAKLVSTCHIPQSRVHSAQFL